MKALISLLLFLPTLAFADVSVPRSKQYAWTQYDVSRDGGASIAHNLGAILPAGAIITDVYVYLETPFTHGLPGNDSLAFQCAGTVDLMDYMSMGNVLKDRMLYSAVGSATANDSGPLIPASAINSNLLNVSQGYGSVPTDCALTAVVRSSGGPANYVPYTAGKATLIVEFFRK